MNLELTNNILKNIKDNKFVQTFIKEMTNYLLKGEGGIMSNANEFERNVNDLEMNKNIEGAGLRQEDCLYQVVEMDMDGVYLKNINNNIVSKETQISQELYDQIGNDDVLRFKDGQYLYEEELTDKFLNSLVDINRYKELKQTFEKESNILENDINTKYKIQEKGENFSILSYENGRMCTITVPNELIPFWAKEGEKLSYKRGKFNRDI